MATVRWGLALGVLLAAGAAGWANVAVPVYKSDPGYQRARIAAQIAPQAVVAAVVFALVWAVFDRSRMGKVAAFVFGTLVLLWGGVMLLGSGGTSFPDERPAQVIDVFTLGARPRGSPRPLTPDETILAGILVFAALSFGGLALVRLMNRRQRQAPALEAKPAGPGSP